MGCEENNAELKSECEEGMIFKIRSQKRSL